MLVACGTNNPPGPASDPASASSSGTAAGEPRPLGEAVDVGGFRVRVTVERVDSDKDGPSLVTTMRVKNIGRKYLALPSLRLECEDPATFGYMVNGATGLSPRRSTKLEVPLFISSMNKDYYAPIPPCGTSASISVSVTSGRPDYTESEDPGWRVDPDTLAELNATLPFVMPGGEPKDPDRPYAWVEDDQYTNGYTVIFVKGRGVADVLKILGGVRRDAGVLDGSEVADLHDEVADPNTYDGPTVLTAAEHDGGVVVNVPFGYYVSPRRARALSRGGVAASYGNTVNGDDHVVVARRGRVVRNFDPFLDDSYDRNGPLREEEGLDLAYDTGPASWTLLERLTAIHVEQPWFDGPQPTYVMED